MIRLQPSSATHSKLFHQIFTANSSLSPRIPRRPLDALPGSSDIIAYTVKPTDTLTGLAITFNMKPEQIKQANQLYSDHLLPGQVLYLRPPGARTPPISNFREIGLQDKHNKKRSSTLEEKSSKYGLGPVIAISEFETKKSNDDSLISPRNPAEGGKKEGVKPVLSKQDNSPKEVVKETARFCSESFNVEGTLTITEEIFVFEPKMKDQFVVRDGVLPYQLFIKLKDIFDCQIVKENSKYLFDASLEISCLENDGSAPTYDFILEEKVLRTVYKQLMKWTSVKKNTDDDEAVTKDNTGTPPPVRDLSSLSISVEEEQDSFMPTLDQPSLLLNSESIKKIVRHLPGRYKLNNWKLLYGTQVHGISLNTFYTHVEERGPTVIVVEDKTKHLFGGFASESWRIEPRFYGTGESFLFKLKSSASRKSKTYHWTGKNSNFMCSRRDFIALGGGNLFGMWLDSDFHNGSSYESDTFGNPCLAGSEDFIITVVEVWGVSGR